MNFWSPEKLETVTPWYASGMLKNSIRLLSNEHNCCRSIRVSNQLESQSRFSQRNSKEIGTRLYFILIILVGGFWGHNGRHSMLNLYSVVRDHCWLCLVLMAHREMEPRLHARQMHLTLDYISISSPIYSKFDILGPIIDVILAIVWISIWIYMTK